MLFSSSPKTAIAALATIALLATLSLAYPAWDASTVYTGGQFVTHEGKDFKAWHWTQNQAPNPADQNGPWEEYAVDEHGNAAYTLTRVFQANDKASYEGKLYKALHYVRGTTPAIPSTAWLFLEDLVCQECCDLADQAAAKTARAAYQKAIVDQLHQNTIWPTSSYIAYALEQENFTALAPYIELDVHGRISPLGTFTNLKATGEYFYGLAGPMPGVPTEGRMRIVNVTYPSPITCAENKCALKVQYTLYMFNDPTNTPMIFIHESHFNFNEDDKICSYEVHFIRMVEHEFKYALPAMLDPMTLAYYNSLSEAEKAAFIHAAVAQMICQVELYGCHGDHDQFATVEECMGFMMMTEFGSWELADQNTVMCRYLHSQMVLVAPDPHCHHVGPTGGGKCVYHSPESYHEYDYDECRDKN